MFIQKLCINVQSSILYGNPEVKTPKHPSTDELINQIWHIRSMEYYWGIKRNVVLHASTWMTFGNIILSEISQTQKDNYCVIPLTRNI